MSAIFGVLRHTKPVFDDKIIFSIHFLRFSQRRNLSGKLWPVVGGR